MRRDRRAHRDEALRQRGARDALGMAWRLGPVIANDPSVDTLRQAAVHAGWHCVERPVGSLFCLDLVALRASGTWPSTKGKQGWTREEDQHILHQVQTAGQKWSVIAGMLPGRTDDAVRNRWNRLQRERAELRVDRDKKKLEMMQQRIREDEQTLSELKRVEGERGGESDAVRLVFPTPDGPRM